MSSRSNGAEPAAAWRSRVDLLRERLRRALAGSLLRNSLYIMATTAATSLLGFGFWLLAAHALSARAVGQAAALVSAMLFVAVITNLGLGQVLVSRLASRQSGREWSLTVSTGLLATALASFAGGVAAAFVVPAVVPELRHGVAAPVFALLPFGVTATACSLVIDFACIAEHQARASFVRNVVAALLRLALLGAAEAASLEGSGWLVATWVVSFLLIDATALARTLPALGRGYRPTLAGWRGELAAIRGLIAGHQAINLGSQAAAYLLPVLVSARLGASDTAYFYAAFMLSSGLFFIAPAVGNSLFAEGARHPDRLQADLRDAARYIAALAAVPALVLLLAGPLLLGLFGGDYRDAGSGLLYVLVGSAVLDAGYQLAIAVLRARGRLREAAIATWLLLATAIVSAWLLLPPLGLIGAGVGWCIGKACGLLVAALMVLADRRERPHTSPRSGL